MNVLKISQPHKSILAQVLAILLPIPIILYTNTKNIIALGLLIAVAIGFLIFKYRLEKYVLLFALLLVPFSVELEVLTGLKVALPAEPLVGILATATCFNILFGDPKLRKILRSPLMIVTLVYVGIMLCISTVSTMPIPSFKFSLVNISYLLGFFILPVILMNEKRLHYKDIIVVLAVSFGCLTIYTSCNYVILGNIADVSAIVPQPFYKDHTIHSATLSLIAPLLILAPKYIKGRWSWLLCIVGVAAFTTMVIAGSRAAWMGFLAAIGLGVMVYFKAKIWHLMMIIIVALGLGISFWNDIEEHFFTNTMDSSAFDSSVEEQVKSLSNVTSDVSNLERLNRWKCAIRMFKDKPMTGYGPGTYQFQFIPFQLSYETTPISVFSPYGYKDGTGGTAHSEYLLALSEMGIFGGLAVVLLMFGVVFVTVQQAPSVSHKKWLWIALTIGIGSFIVHGFLNNFLNSAGFGIIFWMLLSILESNRKGQVA
ncbi:MAG: O-antigen ligase family protein [Flavobacteriales bacterium]|nr:O-antigen ligase family protein [Flavobacteriales bacterium]